VFMNVKLGLTFSVSKRRNYTHHSFYHRPGHCTVMGYPGIMCDKAAVISVMIKERPCNGIIVCGCVQPSSVLQKDGVIGFKKKYTQDWGCLC
jgi:hypothetical protein